ncbi:stage VI sporulation protein F [Paenibacillus turpanensis]|uniref:stage VI sporulation protein F n=1 Tax=Paenibacillus turpanensis TaxID=2689078 RepID=UPI00313338D9
MSQRDGRSLAGSERHSFFDGHWYVYVSVEALVFFVPWIPYRDYCAGFRRGQALQGVRLHTMGNDFLFAGGAPVKPYEKYGISPELVERIKKKMKDPAASQQVKDVLLNLSKSDLQDRAKVKKLAGRVSKILGEKLGESQMEAIIRFVVAQKIDPNNTFHLIKLWGMFR